MWYMLYRSHHFWFGHPNIWRRVQIMMLLVSIDSTLSSRWALVFRHSLHFSISKNIYGHVLSIHRIFPLWYQAGTILPHAHKHHSLPGLSLCGNGLDWTLGLNIVTVHFPSHPSDMK
jgi:hypothetical protein